MALPTKKHTRSQRDQRRAHLKLEPKQLQNCKKCGGLVLPHHACQTCGTYQGRTVVKVS